MGTLDTYRAVMEALKTRLEVLTDTSGNKLFSEVEVGRRGTFDEDLGGAYIIPAPRSGEVIDREFKKTYHQWNFLIFMNYKGGDEESTFDGILVKFWKVYDTLMEVEAPSQGRGYNRTLWASDTKNPLIHDLEVIDWAFDRMEWERGWEQVAVMNLAIFTKRI